MDDAPALPAAPALEAPEASAPDPRAGMVPLTDKARAAFKARITKAEAEQKIRHPWWDHAVKSYAPQVKETPTNYGLKTRTNREFVIVEKKQAELFYQRPEVSVAPMPLMEDAAQPPAPQPGQAPGQAPPPAPGDLSAIHADVLNQQLGLHGVNAKRVAQQAIFDYELFGAGWTAIGFQAWTGDAVDPTTQQSVKVPLYKAIYWDNLSPKQVLIPADCKSTDFDRHAPWLAHVFEMPLTEARRLWGARLPNDVRPVVKREPPYLDQGQSMAPSEDMIGGVRIWYRSSIYRDDRVHPLHLTELVFLDGVEEEVEHRDSPHQQLTDRGQLTPDSMIGFPLHPLIIRHLTDSAYVMSDVAIGMPQTQELNKFREQQVRHRDISLLKWVYNREILPANELDEILTSAQGGAVGLPAKAFDQVGGLLRPLEQTPYTADNYQTNDRIDNDLSRTFGIDADAAGASDPGDITATEASLRQSNRNVRTGKEQGNVVDWWLVGVEKISSLLQRYFGPEDVAPIVGSLKSQLWASWVKVIPSRLAFKITPDSQLRNDTALERKQATDLYSFAANDPYAAPGRKELLSNVLRLNHFDPTKIVSDPPQPAPEKPRMSLAFSGEDLSPMNAQSPIVLELLKANGIQVSAEAEQQAQGIAAMMRAAMVQHGGKLPKTETLDKHADALTGGMEHTGQPTPGLAAGMGQPEGMGPSEVPQ